MLFIKVNPRLCGKYLSVTKYYCRFESIAATTTNEVAQIPAYPPIEDVTFAAKWQRNIAKYHEAVKNIKTIEEKTIKINMPRYWGFKCMMIHEDKVVYNNLPMIQYITRTHVSEELKLPSYYDTLLSEETLNSLVQEIKPSFEDAVAFEMSSRMRHQEYSQNHLETNGVLDDLIGDAVSKQVNRIMLNYLGLQYPHLLSAQIDYDPRIEASWFAGGIDKSHHTIRALKRFKDPQILELPIDRIFAYIGNPTLQLRHELPLKEILPVTDCENPSLEVPVCKIDPRNYGHYFDRRHLTAIPGFWPGDRAEFGLMSYHKCGYMHRRFQCGDLTRDDQIDLLKTQAVKSSWSWLTSQAFNNGFTTFNEITYPLVNQQIITNGQMWSFAVYQLNTNKVWGRNCDDNPKRNICWITEPIQLFEKIENNKLVGVNDDVLKHLIKFYVNVPEERVGVNLKPYVGETEQRIAHIQEDERRVWLEDTYKRLVSHRPRHKLMPEMYHWEWIYKFMFKTRPLDKKRTHWDYGLNPFRRKLNEHLPRYIPKALRPGKVIRSQRDKYAKTYYPE
ncbi:39S ribosomal protein S30, mitochondrial [Chelonus insularis]|uniref:39S ribosomal protein S30, mitochondrial n=1 Tax=Chelonus insularis TaxID=460826 RepID=UPI00158EB2DC|nr:39S ribosomal protein S30, mitochondrial [Chelonus insularis]